MAIIEEQNQPLFLDSQHLLVAVVATIAAQHGVDKTRELVDELADNDATWAAIAQKVEGVQQQPDDAGDVVEAPPSDEPPALVESNGNVADAGDVAGALLGSDGIESAGPDAVPSDPGDVAPNENGAAHP